MKRGSVVSVVGGNGGDGKGKGSSGGEQVTQNQKGHREDIAQTPLTSDGHTD